MLPQITVLNISGITNPITAILLATGSKPRKLQMEGVEHVNYLDNESIFHIKQILKRLLVVRGGPTGMDTAQVM